MGEQEKKKKRKNIDASSKSDVNTAMLNLSHNLIATITEAPMTASLLQVTVTIASINPGIIRSIVTGTSHASQWGGE